MDIFKLYATDEAVEVSGAWKEIGPGAKILVARAGNDEYAAAIQTEVDTHRLQLELGGKAGKRVNDEIMVRVMARTILKGWEGLTFKGEVVTYSYENACRLLALKEFRALVLEIAGDIENFRIKEEEEQGKA